MITNMPHIMNIIIPRGMIMKWSGTLVSIPTGFSLCDGSTINGTTTPDLRARFIRGVNTNSINPGTTGGEDSHTLILSELPSHNHSITETQHQHTVLGWVTNSNNGNASGITNTGGSQEDAASLVSVSVGNTGGGGSHENRPAYYECLYIMKVVDT